MPAPRDPRITDLRRYRRERERARRAKPQPSRPGGNEPLLGGRKNAGLILAIVVAVLIAMSLLSGRHF
jgi:hypothetical protein